MCHCWLEDGGSHVVKKYGQPLGVENGPQLTACMEVGTSVLVPQGNEFFQQHK